ncbi:alpha-1,2-mannosyltransferase (Kre5) [Orbilia oligospora]|uniref:Alpha-1,2-mannosyltransferase (Kre5) n=1 Tax=Orbilia oligospora TaxID=2813651 RepID=A0A7C8N6A6_ORBOL|nr:alpha-1,2-mannosyltransferase (Kre5) [Orbilia oligospora]KAF3084114.1 alpha-1,2-mannosyltransferase (Kre5) [Orbilia oligospora]KAF3094947.1 alpha-1,2-mannosyltransferase (Kre5) [Orbilia oligospora]KAF3122757.1 alpha-1,2-mannosyltransferase (Kre5) [Orbilia oligospora]KAF3134695.1 alpha-1,2-mannosyltransferase (Kre5) [Orbilia oligospora]
MAADNLIGRRRGFLDFIPFRKLQPYGKGFFSKRIRLNAGSTVTIPLAVVVAFPVLIIIVILVLVSLHSDSPGVIQNLPLINREPGILKINETYDKPFVTGCLEPAVDLPRANAAFVVLARNKELDGVIQSMKSIERHFNHWFHYPYVFLNDGEFNESFKATVKKYASSEVEFGQIDSSMWGFPDWVNHDDAKEAIAKQGDRVIMYGGMESYHHMCRFYSGFFYKHPLLEKYKWYWRLEPDIKYFCDITYDPFVHMERHNKTYGYTIAVKELKETVPNLFRYATAYKRLNKIPTTGLWDMFADRAEPPKEEPEKSDDATEDLPKTSPRKPLPDIDGENMEGEKYNMCHFWSNFEIARLDFFRSKEYEDFFQMMDKSGGFWTERWGDAPIHSLAAGILLDTKDIHYFRDIGYRHTTIQHCPANAPGKQLTRKPFFHTEDMQRNKRLAKEDDAYWANYDTPKHNGVGCHCRCDTDIEDVEGKPGSCTPEWVKVAGGWLPE